MVQPLAVADTSNIYANTSLSTMISFSILNSEGDKISILADNKYPIEFIIPQDPNLIITPMALYNVTLIDEPKQPFYFHLINITQPNADLTVSLHIEMRPHNKSINYLLILKFDDEPQLSNEMKNIDDWFLFCSASESSFLTRQNSYSKLLDLSDDGIHNHFIDNRRTAKHEFVVFGIRELDQTQSCSNKSLSSFITDQPFNFSSNYELRAFTSACYYLDSNNNWKTDGLLVSFLFLQLSLSSFCDIGRTFDKSLPNSMLCYASNYFYKWLLNYTQYNDQKHNILVL